MAGYGNNDSLVTGGYGANDTVDGEDQPVKKKRTAGDIARDVGVVGLKGLQGLQQSIIGLADLTTGGNVGLALEKYAGIDGERTQKQLNAMYSDPQQEANRNLSDAKGFTGKISAALENPSTILTTVGESVPQMIGGAGIARGVMAASKVVAPWAAGAIGEGVMGAGSAAESIREQSADGLLTGEQSMSALGSGAGTALFGAAGGKLASKLGIGDIDTMLAQGGANAVAAGAAKKGFIRQVVESGITEGVFEELPQSIQEQMWQNSALGKPLMDGVPEAAAMGLLAGTAMGGAGGGYNAAMSRPAAAGVPNNSVQAEVPTAGLPSPTVSPAAAAAQAGVMQPIIAEPTAAEKALAEHKPLTALDRVTEIEAEDTRMAGRLAEIDALDPAYGELFSDERAEVAAKRQTLDAERAQITQSWPKPVFGNETTVTLPSGATVVARWAVVDAGEVIPSHDTSLRANPRYDKDMQPRYRGERHGYEMQIQSMTGKFNPALVDESQVSGMGAPTIREDGMVVDGNGREIAIQRVYQANGQKASELRAHMATTAENKGIPVASYAHIANPQFTRVISHGQGVNYNEFARQANESTVDEVSQPEQPEQPEQPAATVAPQPIAEIVRKPRKPKVSALATKDPDEYGEAARRAFIQVIKKSGGVSIDDAANITGETRVNSSRMSPGFFAKGAPGIDLVARRLHEAGYITDEEYNDTDGGVQVARDLINSALRKEPVLSIEQQERMAELESLADDAAAELKNEAEQSMLADILGADLTDAEFARLHDGIPQDNETDQQEASRANQQEQDDEQGRRVESQAGETQPGSTEARAQGGESQPGRTAVQGTGNEPASNDSGTEDRRTPGDAAGDQGGAASNAATGTSEVAADRPARPYANSDERDDAIERLTKRADDRGLDRLRNIREAAEYGASESEIAAAIEEGEDALDDLSNGAFKRNNGLKQGFGPGNNDAALIAKFEPLTEREIKVNSLSGRGLYEIPKADRDSLLMMAKVRSIDAFEDRAISERRAVIEKWLDAQDAATRPDLTLTQQTEQDLSEREAARNKLEAEQNASERAALDKKKVDRERDDFTLTGSDRASDANAAQADIFSQPAAKPDTNPEDIVIPRNFLKRIQVDMPVLEADGTVTMEKRSALVARESLAKQKLAYETLRKCVA